MDQGNLLPLDTPSNNNNIQYFNNEQNNNENTLSFTQNYIKMVIGGGILLSALIIGFIVLINSKPNSLAIFIYANVILSVGFFYVVSLFLAIKEIQFIKNTNLNQLNIKIKKVCCFTSRQYTLILENAYIYCEKNGEKRTKIFILNTLKNPREIDLDKSNIKTSPINLLNEHGSSVGIPQNVDLKRNKTNAVNSNVKKKKSIHFSLPSRSQMRNKINSIKNKGEIEMLINDKKLIDKDTIMVNPFDEDSEKKCCPDCNIF
jgi:hypothetical protein